MVYYQLSDSSIVNERPCQETSKFEVSLHLSMIVKSSEGITFHILQGNIYCPSNLSNNYISVKLRSKEQKFSS